MQTASKLLWQPAQAGINSSGIHYSGYDTAGDKSQQLVAGDTIKLVLTKGSLCQLRSSAPHGKLYLALESGEAPTWLEQLTTEKPPAKQGINQLLHWFSWPLALLADEAVLAIEQPCILWLHLPSQPLARVIGEGEIGSLSVTHRPSPSEPTASLPDPLGEIREEFRVPRASARAYKVAKGEYIQVIDVEGRQCSDFMAINCQALEQGRERFIDSTVSRTLAGGAYPQPGLHDKFFDQDMQPLLAVVQDTVGRHDTFALACTEYGYAERGFPGHINCSDNISYAYQPFGIQPRRAWPAINFFFNSWINSADNQLQSDEAWSRPGDYVVMRALTDLICVTTACPDDIDPINGWNPTEIHVRIYQPEADIPRSIGYRSLPESEPFMSTHTPFHPRTSALTQRFHNARNYWLPAVFDATDSTSEYWQCRENVTLQDMSNLRKFDICGPDAEQLLQLALSRNITRLAVHRGYYALLCSEQGAVIDDGTLFRLAPELFRWCCGSDESGRQLAQLAEQHQLKVWIHDQTLKLCNLAVQGPNSRKLLEKVLFIQPSQPSLENIKWFGCAIARIGDRDGLPLMLTRSGFTGELGYELFCDASDAVALWDALMSAGQPLGLTPMGNQALEWLRIEAGLMVSGAEFGGAWSPDDSGLGFAVDAGNEEFRGRQAILQQRQAPRHQLVGLLLEGRELPQHGDTLFLERQSVGQITSACYSPMLRQVIAMARIDASLATPGRQVDIGKLDGHAKRLSAEITSLPFFDPSRSRARA